MQVIARASAAVLLLVAPFATAEPPGMTVAAVTVGRNLQAWASVRLPAPAQQPVQLTLTSDDPSRLLLAKEPDKAGSASITLMVEARRIASPEFCLQGLADTGTATYTIVAEGFSSATGKVNLAPSAIVIVGPHRASKLPTTLHANAARITIVSTVLDSSGKVAGEESVAGGAQVEITLANSNPGAGVLEASKLTIAGGASSADTYFRPAGEGDTTLAPVQPPGFSIPAELASVAVAVAKPGMAIDTDIILGKNLQTPASLCLGEPAPPGGLRVVLTSQDSSKLVLSPAEDRPGSGTITLTVPAAQQAATYYIQALGSSGEVTYEATAPGFRSRTATVRLASSGIIISCEHYGPPEEGNVKRRGRIVGGSGAMFLSRSDKHPVRIVAWSAYLDPESERAADITVQPLRAGLSVTVTLTSSNPAVAKVESPLVIKSGVNRAFAQLTPLSEGSTVISIETPAGFSTPKNATSVPATVMD